MRCTDHLSSKRESHVEFSKHLGKWCTRPSFISSNASLFLSVSAFHFSVTGSIAKSWSLSSEELSISLLSSVFNKEVNSIIQ